MVPVEVVGGLAPPNAVLSTTPPGEIVVTKTVFTFRTTSSTESVLRWKWRGTVLAICLTSMISGYDVSNVGNIQTCLYQSLGHIELLDWITLSYSLAVFSALSFARKVVYCFNLRLVYLVHLVVFMAGTVIAGTGTTLSAVVIGRSVMGIGGAVILQTNMSYLAVFGGTKKTTALVACCSASWAMGLTIGGPIGSALAETLSWRWALFLNLPLTCIAFILSLFCAPNHSFDEQTPILLRIKRADPLGVVFNAVVPELFAVALTFASAIWNWGATQSLTMWILFACLFVAWIIQQHFCILTTVDERALPLHILPRLDLLPIWIATACAGSAYAIVLIYSPLFFAFIRGATALQQSAWLLPFTVSFILTLLLTGCLLPIIKRYKLVYITGGVLTAVGSTAVATSLSINTTYWQVMGLEAIIGVGLGLQFQHGSGISIVINDNKRDRVDSIAFCNLAQFGGIAITLAAAGCIFQNVGYNLLRETIHKGNSSEHEIREALAGVSSALWQGSESRQQGLSAVVKVISSIFFIAVSAGGLSVLCGLVMSSKNLDAQERTAQPVTSEFSRPQV